MGLIEKKKMCLLFTKAFGFNSQCLFYSCTKYSKARPIPIYYIMVLYKSKRSAQFKFPSFFFNDAIVSSITF